MKSEIVSFVTPTDRDSSDLEQTADSFDNTVSLISPTELRSVRNLDNQNLSILPARLNARGGKDDLLDLWIPFGRNNDLCPFRVTLDEHSQQIASQQDKLRLNSVHDFHKEW